MAMEKKRTMNKDLLRLSTAGSVDDGKSTLIGRLLYETNSITVNQQNELESNAKKKGLTQVDLSLITDGLKDERAQGITIDVAYRYFETEKRKFIIADSPGHIQYTRNMITGASRVNLALLLIDARKGIIEQTKRHAFIASLLHVSHIVVCVNKMDLVDYNEAVFQEIKTAFNSFSQKLSTVDIRYIPISALHGDNVVERSTSMPWYDGRSLLSTLENIHISSDKNMVDFRFPVQTVIRPRTEAFPDFRGYAGRVASGTVRQGDEVVILPSGFTSSVESIWDGAVEIQETQSTDSVVLTLKDDIDVTRGDMITRVNNQTEVTQEFTVMLCWMHQKAMMPRTKFIIQHTTSKTKAFIQDIFYKIDINTLHRIQEFEQVEMNDIFKVTIKTAKPLMLDKYSRNKNTGAIILIDAFTKDTVAAGIVLEC